MINEYIRTSRQSSDKTFTVAHCIKKSVSCQDRDAAQGQGTEGWGGTCGMCVSEVSLATCPVLRAGHLRKVSFSAMGNCYPYYTLKRCAVGVVVCCVWAVVSHKTRTDTLTYTHPHPHTHTHKHSPGTLRQESSRGQANYTAWHFISFRFYKPQISFAHTQHKATTTTIAKRSRR